MSMINSLSKFFDKPDFGFLVIRVVAGALFIAAGIAKFNGGEAALSQTGKAMAVFGITFTPYLWGLLAALVETVGGLLLIIGFLFRGAAFFLFGTMVVATATHMGDHFVMKMGYPLIMAAVCACLLFAGPGKLAIQKGGAGSSSSGGKASAR